MVQHATHVSLLSGATPPLFVGSIKMHPDFQSKIRKHSAMDRVIILYCVKIEPITRHIRGSHRYESDMGSIARYRLRHLPVLCVVIVSD